MNKIFSQDATNNHFLFSAFNFLNTFIKYQSKANRFIFLSDIT